MQALIFAVLPLIITGLTSLIKRAPVVDNVADQGKRNVIIRAIAALLSLAGVVGKFMLTGQVPNPEILSDLVLTVSLGIMTFFGSVGGHELLKRK